MTDVTQDTNGKGKPERKAIAKRELIDASGTVVADETLATGCRYTFLATGTAEERQWGQPAGSALVMCANFGWLTKVGNEVNSVKQADDYDGSDPMLAAKEFNALLDSTPPQWGVPGDGTARGPKYDKDTLAGALVTKLGKAATGDVMHYRQRLDDKSYYAKVRANSEVMSQYYKDLAAKNGATKQDAKAATEALA